MEVIQKIGIYIANNGEEPFLNFGERKGHLLITQEDKGYLGTISLERNNRIQKELIVGNFVEDCGMMFLIMTRRNRLKSRTVFTTPVIIEGELCYQELGWNPLSEYVPIKPPFQMMVRVSNEDDAGITQRDINSEFDKLGPINTSRITKYYDNLKQNIDMFKRTLELSREWVAMPEEQQVEILSTEQEKLISYYKKCKPLYT